MKESRNEVVEILKGNKGYVDFAYPISMSVKEKELFLKLLKSIYDPRVVIEHSVETFRRDWRIGERILYPRAWLPEEYLVLLDCNFTKTAMESLGRSWYACELKDADWRYRLIAFCDKHGHDLSGEDKLLIIKKFMKAQEEFNKLRADLRKEKNKLSKELERLNSPEMEKHFEFLKRVGKLEDDYMITFRDKKKKILERLKAIDIEFGKQFDEM